MAIIACPEFASAQTPQFTHLNPLYFTMPEAGPNPLQQWFTLTSTGSNFGYEATVQTLTGGNWLQFTGCTAFCSTPSVNPVSVNGATLPAGTYTGEIIFQVGTTTMTVPVNLTVEPAGAAFFGDFVTELGFVFGGGITPAPLPQSIQVTNAGSGTLSWTVAVSTFGGGSWLNVSAQSGTAPSLVTVSVTAQGLQPGTYTGQLLFQAPGSSFTVPVSLVVVSGTTPVFDQVPSLNFTMPQGGPNPALQQWFTLTSTGSNFGYAAAVETVTGGNWLQFTGCTAFCSTPSVNPVSVNGATLPAGTYTGAIIFQVGTTSMTVPVTLTVEPAGAAFFGDFATEVGFVFGGGITPPPLPQSIQVTNAGSGTLSWTVAVSTFGGGSWLNVSAQSGTAPSLVTVSVTAQGLQPGIYTGQLLFQAPGSSFTVPVSLVVVSGTTPVFDQVPSLNFTMPQGGPNPALQQWFTLTSTGSNFGYAAAVETVTGGNWLQFTGCTAFCSTPSVNPVSVNGATLPAGTYTGEIIFQVGTTTMTVPVTLTVEPASAAFFGDFVTELGFVFGGGITPAPLPQSIQVTNAGSGTLSWTVAVSTFGGGSWLNVSAQSGTAPSLVTVSVTAQGLQPGTYTGQLLFQAPGSSFTVPVSLVVVSGTTPVFDQVPSLNFTMLQGGSNPPSQSFTLTSTGSNFGYGAAVETVTGGNWLQFTGCTAFCSTPSMNPVSVNGATLPAGTYTGAIIFQVGTTNMTVPVTLKVVGSTPTINNGGVVPLYSSVPVIQPGSWISIYGNNLATGTFVWNGDFPTSLGGVTVTIDNKLAYLWLVSPGQINLQAPNDTATGTVNVVVTTPTGAATSSVTLSEFAPSFVLFNSKYAAGVIPTPNGTGANGNGTYDLLGPSGQFNFDTRPVKTGEILVLYGVGFGPTNPIVPAGQAYSGAASTTNTVSVTIGGVPATVQFSGITSAGLYQFNVVVPNTGSGDQLLLASVGGVQTQNNVYVTVQSSSSSGSPTVASITNSVSLSQFTASENTVIDTCSVATNCFSIQQNFFVVTPGSTTSQSANGLTGQATYWVQNVVVVYNIGGQAFAWPWVNVFDAAGWATPNSSPLVKQLLAPTLISLPATLQLTSTLSGNSLTVATYWGQLPLSSITMSPSTLLDTLPLLNNQSYIGYAETPGPPELVLVGGGNLATATFSPPTTGAVTSGITLSNGSSPAQIQQAGVDAFGTQTGETSTGLVWTGLPTRTVSGTLAWAVGSSATFTSYTPSSVTGASPTFEGFWFEPVPAQN